MNFDSLFEMMEAFPDEQSAIDHLRAIRWGDNDESASCPHCGSIRINHFSNKKDHKCADCRKRFSIKVGTIFSDSKIPLRKWFIAIWLITSHKKGVASTTLAKDIKVTQKTAWFMLHRLRHASRTPSFNRKLKSPVEVDETFIGGKEKNNHASKKMKACRGPVGKGIVWGALERSGEFRAIHISSLRHVKDAASANVEPWPTVISDEYAHTGNYYHPNFIEGVWSHIKRRVFSIHHWVSSKHLHRYLSERLGVIIVAHLVMVSALICCWKIYLVGSPTRNWSHERT